jgi:antitoxin (DNA-binding transcriptional repressor) of toxin-antitoxin stability system
MRSASIQELPEQWPEIMRWVAAGEEVAVTRRKRTVAKIVPVRIKARKLDWAGTWAKVDKIFGGQAPSGKPGSQIIIDARR